MPCGAHRRAARPAARLRIRAGAWPGSISWGVAGDSDANGGRWLSEVIAESIELLADQAAERWIPQTFDDNRHDVSALVERWSSKACAARARPPGIGKSARSAHGQQLQRARAA